MTLQRIVFISLIRCGKSFRLTINYFSFLFHEVVVVGLTTGYKVVPQLYGGLGWCVIKTFIGRIVASKSH